MCNNCSCINCAFFKDDTNKCNNENGIFKWDTVLSDELVYSNHNCPAFEEARYILTPKGCLSAAFISAGVDINEYDFNEIWKHFENTMKKMGYMSDEDKD